MRSLGVWMAMAATMTGCVIGSRDLVAPGNDQATVLLLTGGLRPPMDGIARHPWFAVRGAGETGWKLWQVGHNGSTLDPFENEPYTHVRLHAIWRGGEAVRAIACLAQHAPPWLDELRYRAWPGPNSNTFGDAMLRRCGLRASLPAPSIGKDYRGVVGASWTSEGTGFQIETPVLGVRLGFFEGIELHIFGAAVGIDLWPPAIIVPVGAGRVGFDDR